MDIPDYKTKYGEPKTLEEILNYCAFISGQGGLEHRTLHHFNYFVSSLIFGKGEYERTIKWLDNPDTHISDLTRIISKGSVEDGLKIYEKYNSLYDACQESPLLKYATAFMQYCEDEYGETTEL